MEKTEGKKTVIVIDEQGNQYESTYPKRAKCLVKSGRARYVDDNTILILTRPPLKNMEENNNMENNKQTLDLNYILTKIDEIIRINQETLQRADLSEFSSVPGTKNPIQAICDTNNKMIDFLREMYFTMQPKEETINDKILNGYLAALNKAVENGEEILIENLTNAINEISHRNNRN